MFSPTEGEENSTKLLKNFIQEAEQEMTAAQKRRSRQHGFC
jgi:hypothetical protein